MTRLILAGIALIVALISPANAQEREIPYWATIRATELNMRVGPSEDYPIDWVYRRPGLPVKVIRVMEGWRLIEDPAGDQGWVVARMLSPARGAIVTGKTPTDMRASPASDAALKWRVEPGVVGALQDCSNDWCQLKIGKRSGWVLRSRLWGAGEP